MKQIINSSSTVILVGNLKLSAGSSTTVHESFFDAKALDGFDIEEKGDLLIVTDASDAGDAEELTEQDEAQSDVVYVYPAEVMKGDGTLNNGPAAVKERKRLDKLGTFMTLADFNEAHPDEEPVYHGEEGGS